MYFALYMYSMPVDLRFRRLRAQKVAVLVPTLRSISRETDFVSFNLAGRAGKLGGGVAMSPAIYRMIPIGKREYNHPPSKVKWLSIRSMLSLVKNTNSQFSWLVAVTTAG